MNDALTRPQTLREGLESLEYVGAPESIKAGALLGPYRLTKLLGEGGMGAVWLADQLEPFERKVAIKFAHTAASSQNQAYLEVERQALARMVHPYIAQIYDAGATAHGAMFFVMEYVEGVELEQQLAQPTSTKRVDVRLRDAVKLMRKICEGAHYAHQRGLIHRDLKPSNVLVGQLANEAIPKIIDFGIAVGMDPDRGSAQAGTAGTLAYMAPEQLKPTAEGIDVRADVHALGVILVELLSHAQGRRVHLEQAISVREILATGYKSASDESRAVPQSAPQRRQRAAAAIALIPRELRAIARKATAEDRNQRFESAAAMADDLQRWLDRRPVQAMDQGRWYAFRCFVNRYRIASALGALTLAALVIGLVVASYGLSEARAARALADARRAQAEKLLNFMLGDFAKKLENLGKLELIDDVAQQSLQYLGSGNEHDIKSVIQRAAALRTIGDLQIRRNQLDAARKTFKILKRTLNGVASDLPDIFFEKAQLAYWLGYIDYLDRDFAKARENWQEYLSLSKQLRRVDMQRGAQEESYALNNLGTLAFREFDYPTAERSFSENVQLREQLLTQDPNNKALRFALVNAISWKAKTLDANGQLVDAASSYQKQVDLCLPHMDIEDTKTQYICANALHVNGLQALQIGNLNFAIQQLISSHEILKTLTELDPTEKSWLRQFVLVKSNLGWAKYLNNGEDGIELLKQACQIGKRELRSDSSPDWANAISTSLMRCAMATPKQFRMPELISARAILDAFVQAGPDDPRLVLLLIWSNLEIEKLKTEPDLRVLEDIVAKLEDANSGFSGAEPILFLLQAKSLLGKSSEETLLVNRLKDMGFRHPLFMRFLQQKEN